MVDSINGSGKTIIITTKPKAKTESKTGFDDALKNTKSDNVGKLHTEARTNPLSSPAQNNMKILQQQQLMHMQHVQDIAKQVQEGTYKMVAPEVLAEKLIKVISDKGTREKFIKKLLKEETENVSAGKEKSKMSNLELKKLVYLIKESQNDSFDDPELEEMLKEFV